MNTCIEMVHFVMIVQNVHSSKFINRTVKKIGLELKGVKRNIGFFGLSLN